MTDTTTGQRRPTRWSFDNYRTLAVTPAPPGWFAIYRWHDGTYSTDPVVAMLTQQYTGTTWHEIVSDPASRHRRARGGWRRSGADRLRRRAPRNR